MEKSLAIYSSKLLERLDNREVTLSKDNQFYWYFYLKELGKQAQTQEVVVQAVTNFCVNNPLYTILKVVAKRYLTYEICDIAVRKNGLNLMYVPEQYRDFAMCLAAVQNNGGALREVPKQILLGEKGYEICLTAVRNNFTGEALSFVPDCYLHEKEGKVLCENAVYMNGYALKYVPDYLMTKELVRVAVEAPLPERELIWPGGSCSTQSAYHRNCPVLSLVPEKYMSEELVALSARLYPESLRYAPVEFVSRALCFDVIERNPMNLQYLPQLDEELVNYAIKSNPWVILTIPMAWLTIKLCRDALRRDSSIPIEKFPENIRKELEKEFCSNAFIKYKPLVLKTPIAINKNGQMVSGTDEIHTYDLSDAKGANNVIYYITDIHLEHQLVKRPGDILKLSLPEVRRCIKEKIAELLTSVPNTYETLLIGGDVADSVELVTLFYEQLASFDGWRGRIIAVLGNHELWDGNPTGLKPTRPIDEIIDNYRQAMPNKVILLENELLVVYKGLYSEILNEETILNASIEELTEICANSTFLLFGGIGFSGLNPVYNATKGLYRATVSIEEDIARSKRFRMVYEKILVCAENLRVIVLTHTQIKDWTNAQYNPKWIYVSGHTHQNAFLLQQDGTAAFYDNQVGYKPKQWHLNNFTIDIQRYNLFKDYPDGIHQITHKQYAEFNRYQEIMMSSMKYPGDIYVLKTDGIYMFVLKSTNSLCLLAGGKRHKLNHDIDYYYKNLPEYVRKIRYAFTPYMKALSMISSEIRAIGGTGTIHGCIVDIDWCNHIYLNWVDGKVTPYYAIDMTNKIVFKDVKALLKLSPHPPLLQNGESILTRFTTMAKEGKIPVLSRSTNMEWEFATVSQVILERGMYKPSSIMRSIQYVFDQNVLRIWNDAVFSIDDNEKNTHYLVNK